MVNNKVNHIEQSGANVVLAADMGCLMNIAGRIKRRGIDVRVYHIAEVLADMVQDNGIGGDSAQ
jgi:L-lactate dehydrogenase complex protein LldE